MAIRESNLANITVVETRDFVRVVNSAGESRKALVSDLAKTIIEDYAGSEVSGKPQSIKTAIEVDSSVIYLATSMGWTES